MSDWKPTVCVVGLGKIGLPLAAQYASQGLRTIGADIDEQVVASVNAGTPPFPGEAHLDEHLRTALDAGLLEATTSTTDAVGRSDVVVVVVPLLVTAEGAPRFGPLDSATNDIARGLKPGTLVLYETTLPVGTTRDRFAPMLADGSGLEVGTDLLVAFSPERVFSGRIFADLRRYPKLVGGIDRASTERAIDFYTQALAFDDRPDLERDNGVWDLGSAEAAELAKLAETTYRDINIAFANELALSAERSGIDVHAVIDAANSQPYSHIHRPGVAVGGHCIPVYPRLYLLNAASGVVTEAGRRVNESMPGHAVRTLSELRDLDGATVVVLGLAYRGGVKETAFSGAFPLVSELERAGARPLVHDPLYSDQELAEFGFDPYHLGEPCDAAIVQTDHDEYRSITPDQLPGIGAIYDGRLVLDAGVWRDRGVMVHQIGRPRGGSSPSTAD